MSLIIFILSGFLVSYLPELGTEYLTMTINLVISGQIISKLVMFGIFTMGAESE